MVVRNDFHRLLNQLVALVFETFLVSELSSIDTATEVVVLRRRGWRSRTVLASARSKGMGRCSPVAIGGNNILDPKLLTDLFNTQMKRVCFELFTSHVRHDGSWKSHEASSLVVSGVAPAISLLASPGSIARWVFSCI